MKQAMGSVVLLLALSASGCATKLQKVNAIPVDRIDEVVREVKRQVSVYHSQVNQLKMDPSQDRVLVEAKRRGFVCGEGKIDFEITSVTMTLATTETKSASGSIGFSIPVVPAGSVGPSLSGSRTVDNVQELTIPLHTPLPGKNYVYPGNIEDAPIATVLLGLRKALIDGATGPGSCMVTYNFRDKPHDKGGTYKLGLTITTTGKASLDIKLAPVAASAAGEAKSVTGNTLLVSFRQAGVFKDPELDPGGLGQGVLKLKPKAE